MNQKRNKSFDLRARTRRFAIRTVRFCRGLGNNAEAWAIRKQLSRSATSVGANYHEACRARSPKEFVSKLEIACQECEESLYWFRVVRESGLNDGTESEELAHEANELLAILIASAKTARSRS